MDRVVGAETAPDDERMRRHFHELVAGVEAHLAMVFHRYLSSGSRRLRIHINGQRIDPWDPFIEAHPSTQSTPEERIVIQGYPERISVRGFVLPHRDRLSSEEHSTAAGPGGWNAQQGFYLYRNERLIVAGSWLGLGGSRPWTQEEHYKLARIRIDIPNSMDHLWHLDVKKSSAAPPPQLRQHLTGLAQAVRNDARAVYAYRGRYRGRTRRDELARPWTVVQVSERKRYRIDRSHPLIAALLAAAPPDLLKHLEVSLRIIEETVPVEQIWLDIAERPDSPAPPLHGASTRQIHSLIRTAYQALRRNRADSHEDAIQLLYSCEEFASAECRAMIATLQDEYR